MRALSIAVLSLSGLSACERRNHPWEQPDAADTAPTTVAPRPR
ncbi:Hypothetical protein A7982_01881 [Minicystis rosea]|nr:Hypothetical protein A7982_01881 [Minicystis rosea]